MKYAAALLLMLAAAPLCAAAATVPAGVEIPVALSGAVSSASVKPGDAFHFKTMADVRAGDVLIPAGTAGTGKIADAASGGHAMKSGSLALEPQTLTLAGGDVVHVAIAPHEAGTVAKKTRAHMFPLPFMLGGVFFLGAAGSPAKNVTLADGTKFAVVTTP